MRFQRCEELMENAADRRFDRPRVNCPVARTHQISAFLQAVVRPSPSAFRKGFNHRLGHLLTQSCRRGIGAIGQPSKRGWTGTGTRDIEERCGQGIDRFGYRFQELLTS